MRPTKDLLLVKDSLKGSVPCSSLEATMLHALVVLEKNDGNRTASSKELKVALRTMRNYIRILRSWGLEVPPSKNGSGRPRKPVILKSESPETDNCRDCPFRSSRQYI